MSSDLRFEKAWFFSSIPLPELGEKLVQARLAVSFSYDCENDFEWIELDRSVDISNWNISRKHHYFSKGRADQEPTVIFLGKEGRSIQAILAAEKIAKLLNTKVHLGNIEYVKGNQFKYQIGRTIDPPQ